MMARPRDNSYMSSAYESEPEDESLIQVLEGITQSHIDINFSDEDLSTSASTYIPWRVPSNELWVPYYLWYFMIL